MNASIEQLMKWMKELEDENLEFKEAKQNYHFDDLVKYSAALANEGGGRIVLGVSDKRPRKVVGTRAFPQVERTRAGLIEKLPLRVDVEQITHPDWRVLVFSVPPRPIGTPIQVEGVYWARRGDSLVPMPEDQLRFIFEEVGHDFSADVVAGASLDDLDPAAIAEFRKRWRIKSGNVALDQLSPEQLLRDAEAVTESGLTYAALILFGQRGALRKNLPQAEVVFEYRSNETAGPAGQRKEYQQGFFSFYDDLWNTINLRNDNQHYQEGFFVLDIQTFEERSVREAVLNAISHRNYRLAGSVFIRQFPTRIVIESPGGFPPGIKVDNILDRQYPRNRRIADIFAKCGLVERSGQGMNLMFEQAIRQGKMPPDFTGTDRYQVTLTLQGQVQDPAFIRFLERIGQESAFSFTTLDLVVLDLIHRGKPLTKELRSRLPILTDHGIIESVGRGRGAKYILSRRFYKFLGEKGVYTRRRGLDRETNKQLLLNHLKNNQVEGSQLRELAQVLPALTKRQVQGLLQELRAEGRAHSVGRTNAARWYPGQNPKAIAPKPGNKK